MSEREYKFFLQDIVDDIERIKNFISKLDKLEDLENNDLVLYAVLKAFENIGEATKHIPNHIKEKYPYFWKEVSGLRDVIVHHYWGLDMEVIYDIIENEIEDLQKLTKEILDREFNK